MSNIKVYTLLIIGIWLGMIIGISFIETPLKFTAPNMTTKLGLGIGQIIFKFLNKAELIFSLLLIAFYTYAGKKLVGKKAVIVYSILACILIAQTFWLLPMLDVRVYRVLNNLPNPNSYIHHAYVIGEVNKLILLFILFKITAQYERH